MSEQKQFYYQYDLDSTSYKYGRIGPPVIGSAHVTTVGSSTTVSAQTAGTYPFSGVVAGDLIQFWTTPTTCLQRKVATVVSPTSITIDTAADLSVGLGSGVGRWYFLPFKIGTDDTDGWHRIAHFKKVTLHIVIATLVAAGGVDIQVQVRGEGTSTTPETIFTKNYAAAGVDAFDIDELASDVRVGLKGGSGFAGTDSISVYLRGTHRS